MRRLFIIALILHTSGPNFSVERETLAPEDIIIVEIRAKDLGLSIKSDAAYQKNFAQRAEFRKATAAFIADAKDRAAFILLDAWYPELVDPVADAALSSALGMTKNITIGSGSVNHGEYTIEPFRSAVPEVGHLFMDQSDKNFIYSNLIICGDWNFYYRPLEECKPESRQRHIALIALEGFLGRKVNHPDSVALKIARSDVSRFQRISYTEYKSNPVQIVDKLVILVPKSVPSVDMHKIRKNLIISGSELLAFEIQVLCIALCEQ